MIALALIACMDTGGQRIAFDVVAAPAPAAPFTDPATGWEVTFDRAELALGPLYVWSGEPLASVPNARGATDDFEYGFLRGEYTDQVAVDLLGDRVSLGLGLGLAGEANSAELWLAPPIGGVDLDDTLALEGTATKDDVTVPFVFAFTIDDDVVDAQAGETAFERRKVRGIPLEAELTDGGTLTVGIDPARTVAGIDWAQVEGLALEPGAPVPPGTVPFLQLYYDVRLSGAAGPYALTWTP